MARPLHVIAREVIADNPKAKDERMPIGSYCVPMLSLDTVNDRYYAESGAGVVRGFLANAGSWRGETARRIKAELKSLI